MADTILGGLVTFICGFLFPKIFVWAGLAHTKVIAALKFLRDASFSSTFMR